MCKFACFPFSLFLQEDEYEYEKYLISLKLRLNIDRKAKKNNMQNMWDCSRLEIKQPVNIL